jgi:hypothetical protein
MVTGMAEEGLFFDVIGSSEVIDFKEQAFSSWFCDWVDRGASLGGCCVYE